MQRERVLRTPVRSEFYGKVRLMCKVTIVVHTGKMELISSIGALSIVCMEVQCTLRSNGGAATNQVISFIRDHPFIQPAIDSVSLIKAQTGTELKAYLT